jgi:hypothetical protein
VIFKRKPPKQKYSLLLIVTHNGDRYNGVMPGDPKVIRSQLEHVQEHQCGAVILPTEKYGERLVEGDEIKEFTVAAYDGPHWWES